MKPATHEELKKLDPGLTEEDREAMIEYSKSKEWKEKQEKQGK